MRRRRRGCGCVTQLLVLLVMALVGIGLSYAFDALVTAPWAYGIFGRSTLTGSWTGTLSTSSGAHYALYLHLERSRYVTDLPTGEAPNSRGLADIFGDVSWCARGGRGATSNVHGMADRSASNVSVGVDEWSQPGSGVYPSTFQGAWHGSTLTLRPSLELFRNNIRVSSFGTPDEMRSVSLTLHKGTYGSYQTACRSH